MNLNFLKGVSVLLLHKTCTTQKETWETEMSGGRERDRGRAYIVFDNYCFIYLNNFLFLTFEYFYVGRNLLIIINQIVVVI